MAEEHHQHQHHLGEEKSPECKIAAPTTTSEEVAVETQDRGLFDFMGKKKEQVEEKKPYAEEEVIVTEFEKVHVSEPEPKVEYKEEEKKESLLEKLHRSNSSSSSSSSDEEEEGEEKKKKKKEKKKKGLKEKILGEKKEEKHEEDTSIPIEKCEEVAPAEEKKGFLEKIKDKLPGQHKKTEEVVVVAAAAAPPPPPPQVVECVAVEEVEPAKEKKGFLEKIKEKLPGYHPKTTGTEEEKEKEKESASY